MRLLLIEDHRAMRDMIADFFRRRGLAVDAAQDGRAARDALASATYDALILDLGLPDVDGLDLLRALRDDHRDDLPALILSARDSVADRIDGLNAGADDYILKPFELTELEARLHAVLRRPGTRREPLYRFGNATLDVGCRTARIDRNELSLTRREIALFEELMKAAGRIVVKDTLEDRLYGFDDPVSVNALEATVSRLRRKLVAADASIEIAVVRGIGYRLQARADG